MRDKFTKWVPVDGKIEFGDHFITPKGVVYKNNGFPIVDHTNDVKAELFLCSIDLQVGDTVQFRLFATAEEKKLPVIAYYDTKDEHTAILKDGEHEIHTTPGYSCYKLVGQISHEARSFVRAGRRFQDNEWRILITNPNNKLQSEIQVIGPCGYHH